MLKKIAFIAAMLVSMPVVAQGTTGDTLHVKVNGMVCDFCVRSIEKTFGKRKDVSGVKVDLDAGLVTIDLKPAAELTDAKVKTMFLDAGYTVTGIHHKSAKP